MMITQLTIRTGVKRELRCVMENILGPEPPHYALCEPRQIKPCAKLG
jgi:hypothetical protein